MSRLRITVFCLSSFILVAGMAFGTEEDLAAFFMNPPNSAKPHTWWHWINGNISKEGITADLEAMKRVGIGGAQIFDADCGIPSGTVKFMTDEWRQMMKHTVEEAERLGIELCMHNCAGWANSGGPWISPKHAMQMVVTSEVQVAGPKHFSEQLPQPETRHEFYRDIAVLAFQTPTEGTPIDNLKAKTGMTTGPIPSPEPSEMPIASPASVIDPREIVNLTNQLDKEGVLSWQVPEGEWTILRIGHTLTGEINHPAVPEGRGLECDKMSREALDIHWAGMMEKIISDIGPLAGKVLNNSLIDSYEKYGQNWTPLFRQEFERRRGYKLLDYLPVFTGRIVESREISERFLWDLRLTIAELFAENYFGRFSELCHKNGMMSSAEAYGNGPFDAITCGGRADIPMAEFFVMWSIDGVGKIAASTAHIYGKTIVGAEAFTAIPGEGRWKNDPYGLKSLGDLTFTEGINRLIFHRYTHQPWKDVKPGMTMGQWGFHFERTVTWFEQGRAWLEYLARCQYMLQKGLLAADVCYFAGESPYADFPIHPELKTTGYDYDVCNTEVLLTRMTVQNGRLVLPDGMSYSLLVLPDSRFMTPQTLARIRKLVHDGATVLGRRPEESPSLTDYPMCDRKVKDLADELWGDGEGESTGERIFGKGRVIWGEPLKQVLRKMGLRPDFEYLKPDAKLSFIHRVVNETDIYFVSNQGRRSQEVECTFRVAGKVPELWHPDTGKMEMAPEYRVEDGRTIIPLRFEPAGSMFVIFREKAGHEEYLVKSTRIGPTRPAKAPNIEIREAIVGSSSLDVTEKVAGAVNSGLLSLHVTDDVLGCDPMPEAFMNLRVDYVHDGKPHKVDVIEYNLLEFPPLDVSEFPEYELAVRPRGTIELKAWQAGTYELTTSSGGLLRADVKSIPKSVNVEGPWTLSFPSGWGAPAQITLDKLISWTQHDDPGVRYFSGTATYTKEFEIPSEMLNPSQALCLDIGQVKNLCEIRVNGKDFGIFWKPPVRLDITDIAVAGKNLIEIQVTNLWPNRLIGDEREFPEDVKWRGGLPVEWPKWFAEGKARPTGRHTFTTFKHYTKDSPLLESGLLGPVMLRAAKILNFTVEPSGMN